ncbi:MAG: translation initiation factor IF-6 [Theionarchaea archaeon]|nr:translation initiation factor IF-6 [Theionarchaea archaeon]MBU7036891.1 translation initiation factor IF-6 [Theionarchaea archaeon]
MISKLDFEGISFIGVYGLCTDTITLIRPDLGKKLSTVERVLNTPVLETTIGRSYLIGVFATGNSTCLVVPYFAEPTEVESVEAHVTCAVYPEKFTALGNLVLANDKACIVSPVLDAEFFQDALGTEVVRAQLGEFLTVGSVGVVTNKAGVLHPQLSDEDIEFVEDVLQISCERATANRGVGYLRLCLLANTKGILAGRETTGPELVRIEDILEG